MCVCVPTERLNTESRTPPRAQGTSARGVAANQQPPDHSHALSLTHTERKPPSRACKSTVHMQTHWPNPPPTALDPQVWCVLREARDLAQATHTRARSRRARTHTHAEGRSHRHAPHTTTRTHAPRASPPDCASNRSLVRVAERRRRAVRGRQREGGSAITAVDPPSSARSP